jgi:hypothetical protein
MTEREDKVYQAKLAEQAERYDGKKANFFDIQMRFVGKEMGVGARIVKQGRLSICYFSQVLYKHRCTFDKGYAYLKSGFAKILKYFYLTPYLGVLYITGAFIDLLSFSLLVEKYFINIVEKYLINKDGTVDKRLCVFEERFG